MDHGRASKIDVAVPQTKVAAQLGEPAAAPHPVGIEGVNDGAHDDAVDHEGLEAPALGHGPRGDGGGGVHEDHLEEKHGEDRNVIAVAGKEEALCAE